MIAVVMTVMTVITITFCDTYKIHSRCLRLTSCISMFQAQTLLAYNVSCNYMYF